MYKVYPPERAMRTADRRWAVKAAFIVMFLVVTSSLVSMNAIVTAQDNDPVTHTVLMTDNLVFSPKELRIEPGDTVVWKNEVGSGVLHTVTAYEDDIPAGAAYFASGDFTSESAARSNLVEGLIPADGEYRHTFTVNGTYEYFCMPHELAGMTGSIFVGETGPAGDEDGIGFLLPIVLGTVVGVVIITLLAFWAMRGKRKVP